MKNNFDDLKLVNTALADQSWEAYSAQLRNEGLARLRAKRLNRRLISYAQFAAILTISAVVLWNFNGPRAVPGSQPLRAASSAPNSSRADLHSNALRAEDSSRSSGNSTPYITEEEMLAMFPKGTCVVAEVNGQKELVFLDQKSLSF